jgi:hypothetical protein
VARSASVPSVVVPLSLLQKSPRTLHHKNECSYLSLKALAACILCLGIKKPREVLINMSGYD